MADLRAKAMQKNFTAGEFSRKMDARVDLSKYENAAKTVENFIVYPQGGVTRRPGFRYINSVKDDDDFVRLIPFEYSTEQAYVLEFGDKYIRIYMNGGRVQSIDAQTVLLLHCDGNNGSQTFTDESATPHTPTVNGNAQVSDAVASPLTSGGQMARFWSTPDSIQIPDSADFDFGDLPFTIDFWVRFATLPSAGSGSSIYRQAQDGTHYTDIYLWNTAGVYTMNFDIYDAGFDVQLSYTMTGIAIDTDYHVAVIRGWGSNNNDWVLCVSGQPGTVDTSNTTTAPTWAADVYLGGPGGGYQLSGYLEEFRVSKGVARWTAAFQPPTVAYPLGESGTATEVVTPYLKEHLSQLKYAQSADKMWICHPEYVPRTLTRSDHVTWTIADATLDDPPADPAFSVGDGNNGHLADANDGSGDCAGSVGFFEERLWFGGSTNNPQTLWSTVSSDFEDMDQTGTNGTSAGIFITIAADQVNAIRAIEPGSVLHVFTTGGEWRVSAGSLNDPILTTDVVVKRQTTYGTANIQPVTVGKHIIFAQRAALKLREYGYNFDMDGFISSDLNLLSSDITESGLKYVSYQQEPYSILWSVIEDGTLLGLTYQRDHEVIGWHRHTIGGTNSEVESIAVIPGSDEDELWAAIKTDIDGSTARFVCQMQPIFSEDTTEDAFFVDFGLTYDGSAVSSVSGLDHLEGEAVDVLADGATLATTPTVTSGAIALGASYSVVHAGFSYNSNLELLRLEKSVAGNDLQGLIKTIWQITLRLYESKEVKFGSDTSDLEAMTAFDATTSTETGDFTQVFPGTTDQEGYVYIRQDQPLPLTVLGVMEYFNVSDE